MVGGWHGRRNAVGAGHRYQEADGTGLSFCEGERVNDRAKRAAAKRAAVCYAGTCYAFICSFVLLCAMMCGYARR